MKKTLFLALILSACTATWEKAARVTEVSAVGSLACDGGQTRQFLQHPESGEFETNPILGTHPSGYELWTYMGALAFGVIVANKTLPAWAATLANLAVTGVEAVAVRHNIGTGSSMCGLGTFTNPLTEARK